MEDLICNLIYQMDASTVDIQYNIKAIAFITVNQTHFTKILSKRKISSGIKVPLLISFLHS